jgi:hypothetical protein
MVTFEASLVMTGLETLGDAVVVGLGLGLGLGDGETQVACIARDLTIP